ncbi:MAG TPA: UDP-galactopyranose mutase [Pseudolabrys sp.]
MPRRTSPSALDPSRKPRLIVVGSGFCGATIAHKVVTELALPVLVIERRDHVGGNSHSRVDGETGIEYHEYGSHLFHTSNETVWKFITQFSPFNNYRHRVFSRHKGKTYTIPINLMTMNQFFGTDLSPAGARTLIERLAAEEYSGNPENFEQKAISLIGRPLYEAFIKGYTAKQWETDPALLPAEIISRLPVRYGYNDFYFSDLYEGLPTEGYAAIFDKMLAHPLIEVATGCDYFDVRGKLDTDALCVFTGPVDRYFNYKFGELGWRTLDFEIERLDIEDFQGAAVVNYPDPDVRFTRIHEFKHLHPERRSGNKTLIMREYSRFAQRNDEPYYPIGRQDDKLRYLKYKKLAEAEPNVIFAGRLGTYRYLDMHQAIGAALNLFETKVTPLLTGKTPEREWQNSPPLVPSQQIANELVER